MKLSYLSIAAGVCMLLYFTGILFVGHGSNFFVIWLAGGLILLGIGFLLLTGRLPLRISSWSLWTLRIVLVLGAAVFVVIEGMIVGKFTAKGPEKLDTIIVLGAQMKETGPSRVLQLRLDTAYDYLAANPDTKVIVSGGQGSNEPVSEARGMADDLIARGIAPERILLEDLSVNTVTNLNYSRELLPENGGRTGIVTSNFHIFRALRLAAKAGYQEVYGIAAPSDPGLLPNNMLREFFGVCKDFLAGNL